MTDKAQQKTIETLEQIANNRHFQDNVDENLQWNTFLDVFLNIILNEQANLIAKFDQALLREGKEVYLHNDEIVNVLSDNYPDLAVFYDKHVKDHCMDGNDLYDKLEQLIKDSPYADTFKKCGYTLMLHIHDERIDWAGKDENGDYYYERYVNGLGLQLSFNNHDMKEMDNGINEKTGEYQYIMYVTE